MTDKILRTALREKLSKRPREANIFEELGVKHGSARVDLAVVNTILHGFELKSDRDSLQRLESQMRIFNSVFDRMTLVVGYRHAGAALKIIPEWWGVILARIGGRGGVHFSTARSPQDNPSVDKHALVKLLWKEEALLLLQQLGLHKGMSSKPRKLIFAHLAEHSTLSYIRQQAISHLIKRKIAPLEVPSVSDGDLWSQRAIPLLSPS